MKSMTIAAAIMAIMVLASPVFAGQSSIPEQLTKLDPGDSCHQYGLSEVWNIEAQLSEYDGQTWMVVFYDPAYTITTEPQVDFKASFAVYQGRVGNKFYYRLGKMPAITELGKIYFETPMKAYHEGHRHGNRNAVYMLDHYLTMRVKKLSDTTCLELTPF